MPDEVLCLRGSVKMGLFLCERSISSSVGAVVIMAGAVQSTLIISFSSSEEQRLLIMQYYVLGGRSGACVEDEA